MRLFYIYFKGFAPAQMPIKFPHHAQYPPKNPDGTDPEGPIIYLFVEGCKQVTGFEPESKLELFKEGLNYPFNDAVQGLAKDQLMMHGCHSNRKLLVLSPLHFLTIYINLNLLKMQLV